MKTNKLWLFKELRRHRKLAEKRMVDFEKNKVAKFLSYFVLGVMVVYLMMFAVTFALVANKLRTMSSLEFMCALAPFVAAIDFLVRFMAQQTPSQLVKPYILLPVSRYTCIDFFIAGQMLNTSNLLWFVMIVPYCLMSVLFSYGFWPCVGLLLFFWLLELCVSQFYLITRTLITDTMLWWIMPGCVALAVLSPAVDWGELMSQISTFHFNTYKLFDFEDMTIFFSHAGTGIETGGVWPYLMMMALLAALTFINRKIQYSHVIAELSRVEQITTIKNPSSMQFLDRMGELGLYLGLEIKTAMRNKNPRKAFITGIVLTVMLSLIIIFTDVYDNIYMTNFWCIYFFGIFSTMTLVKVMANEGNYIDGLMVRKENILQILRAKYCFNCIILLLPLVLSMPPVISGKWSLLMVVACGIFTAGFQLFLLFQLAVINRSSQPLNTKFISKNGIENNKWQFIIEMICLFVPVVLISIMQITLGVTWAYIVMIVIGMTFILTHRLWLRNIYTRFMRNRYKNMEGFRATR